MSGEMRLVFYDGWEAPSSHRARFFIREKGRDVDVVFIDVRGGEHLEDWYQAINPACLVPALRTEEGVVVTENDGIATYLEALWPDPPLLGRTPLEQGQIAEWNNKVELEGLQPLSAIIRNTLPDFAGKAIPGREAYEQIPELATRGKRQVRLFLDVLEARLSSAEYMSGKEFGYADISAIIFIDLGAKTGLLAMESYPQIQRWAGAVRNRSAYLELWG